MTKNSLGLFGIIASCFVTSNAFAWWDQSHMFITELATVANGNNAQAFLTADARAASEKILKTILVTPGSVALAFNTSTFPAAAVWADSVGLFAGQLPSFAKCHSLPVPVDYINVQITADQAKQKVTSYLDAHKTDQNLVSCLKSSIKTLKSSTATDADKAIALRLALNLLGETASPVHTSSFGDMGGDKIILDNPFSITLTTGKYTVVNNVHELWDAGMGAYAQFEYSADQVKQGLYSIDALNYVNTQAAILASLPDYKNLPVNAASVDEESIATWLAGTYLVAQNFTYSNLPALYQNPTDGTTHVGNAMGGIYDQSARWPAVSQMYIGGVHTAKLLTALFDPAHAEAGYVKMVNTIVNDASVKALPF